MATLRVTSTVTRRQLIRTINEKTVELATTGSYTEMDVADLLTEEDVDDILESLLKVRTEGDCTLAVDSVVLTVGAVPDVDFRGYLMGVAASGGSLRGGSVTFTGAEVLKAVVLSPAMPSAAYAVIACAEDGTVPSNVNVWVDAKLAGGFQLNISAPPGGADTTVVNWAIVG